MVKEKKSNLFETSTDFNVFGVVLDERGQARAVGDDVLEDRLVQTVLDGIPGVNFTNIL